MLDIGLEIRILRERLKVSAKELAERVGLSQSQMSRLEKGQRRIDTKVLHRIADALGVDPSHFFRGGAAPTSGDIPAVLPGTIGKLIRTERRRRHLSAEELASRVGKTKAIIHAIEEGKRDPDAESVERILKALRVPAAVLIDAQQQMIHGLETQVERLGSALADATRGQLDLRGEAGALTRSGVPVLGSLADGYPSHWDAAGRPVAETVDYIYVPELDHDDAFALHAVGDSMESPGSPSFREGDFLVFTGATPRSRDFAFVRLADAPAEFRQVFFESGGQVRLQPLNLNYASALHARADVLGMWRLVGHVRRF